jgi:perosamine synthetase
MNSNFPVYQPSLKGKEKEYVLECLDSNWISSRGSFINRFEKEFARYVDIEFATSVCNGTAAVFLALNALGVGEGDEVIVPTLVYVAVPNMVKAVDAIPVFVDSRRDTYQQDPEDILRKITPRTKAVIAVHNYGHPCDMESIRNICDDNKLVLIEDCAEAIGSKFRNKHVGFWGDISVYSFFGNKTITTGEGGMVTSHSEELIRKVFHLKNQGVTSKTYWHDLLAYNFRMTNITAAIGLAQLERIDEILQRKKQIGRIYGEEFRDSGFEFHSCDHQIEHSYWMCSILSRNPEEREPLRDYLLSRGIETRPFFYPAHTMPVYAGENQEDFPVAVELGSRGINLPSYPDLTDEEVRYIASVVKEYTQ